MYSLAGAAGAQWFLVYTKSAAESIAQVQLERQGYEVYYPRVARRRTVGGRVVERVEALFPRYLFTKVQMARQSLAPVRSTIGVASVVSFGGRIAVVADEVVEALRRGADPESGLHRLHSGAQLRGGASVVIGEGLFAGLEGVFERVSGRHRVEVLLQVLGGGARVCVDSASIVVRVA